jgi:hypothetical protein
MKVITLRVEDDEHHQLKQIALDAGITLKALLLGGVDGDASRQAKPRRVAVPKVFADEPPGVDGSAMVDLEVAVLGEGEEVSNIEIPAVRKMCDDRQCRMKIPHRAH